jgi:translocation and assembly module TamA
VTSVRGRVGRAQATHRIDRLAFVELERAIVRRPELPREQADALSINYHGIWRRLDNKLLPSDGYALSLQSGAGFTRASGAPNGPFVRLYGRLTGYRAFGLWHAEGRVELGQVFKRDAVVVPDTQRFRAGGDESVRGYAYRSLAPTVDGVTTSGNVLFTASAELAHPITPRLPSVWGAVFVDAGHSALRWGDLKPAYGVGVGVRWRSPVGPIKVDLARGNESDRVRLHLSVGVTF